MAVILKSDRAFEGVEATLPSLLAPMPSDAAFYVDGMRGQVITKNYRGGTISNVLKSGGLRSKYVRGLNGLVLAPEGGQDRIEYDALGNPLGLLIEGAYTQRIAAAQRGDISQASLDGITAVPGPGAGETRWWVLTAGGGNVAHSVTFSAPISSSGRRRSFTIEVSPGSARFVQVSAGTGGAFANFDLDAGEVGLYGGTAAEAYIYRTRQGYLLHLAYSLGAGGMDDQPRLAIVGASDAPLRQAHDTTATVQARAPKMVEASTTEYPIPRAPHPQSAVSSGQRDFVEIETALLSPASDFTVAMRFAAGPWGNKRIASLFYIFGASGGMDIQFPNGLPLSARTVTTNGSFGALNPLASMTLTPAEVYSMVISKSAQTLRVCGEGFRATVTDPLVAGTTLRLLGGAATDGSYALDGYLQRLVGWQSAKTMSEMEAILSNVLV